LDETEEDLLGQLEIITPEPPTQILPIQPEPIELSLTPIENIQEEELNLAKIEADLGMEVQGPAQEEILSNEEVDERLADFGDYDPKLDLSRYEAPSIELLKNHTTGGIKITKE
jgi:S-DNA-T family DNA segregation ATPase FtsK/SpoIIIE